VIRARSGALSRFMAAYARLARLPPPVPRRIAAIEWVRRIVALEPRLAVQIIDSPAVDFYADEDQLDQLLINLVRNAVDAALETGGEVSLGWKVGDDVLEISVIDEGPGLAETSNLFVPFFTTKPHGSGIGLALSRQIAEAHGGTLTLQNRSDRTGCLATLRIPTSGPG
jgi:two-component system nitrogen regulation sensor histidine kinase NtrY